MKSIFFTIGFCVLGSVASGQVTISKGGGLYLGAGAELVIQGDLETAENIQGDGTFILNGGSMQSIHSYSKTIPSLTIDNLAGVRLLSPITINRQLQLTYGNLQPGKYDVVLSETCLVQGDKNSFIETDAGGRVIKHVDGQLSQFLLPVGSDKGYAPLILSSTGSSYHGSIEVTANGAASANVPANTRNHLGNYWTVNRRNVAGDVSVTAFYESVNGDAEALRPYYWNGHKWTEQQNGVNAGNKSIQINIPEGRGEIFAMSNPAGTGKTIIVAPNPVGDVAIVYLDVPADETTVLRVIDANGIVALSQRVNLRRGSNRIEMSVAAMAAGTYNVVATSFGRAYTVPMIKR